MNAILTLVTHCLERAVWCPAGSEERLGRAQPGLLQCQSPDGSVIDNYRCKDKPKPSMYKIGQA